MSEKIYICKRLREVAAQLKGKVVADVGCDGANLAIWLAQNKGVFTYACDVREGPLQKAKVNVQRFNVAHLVKLIKSNGLEKVPSNVNEVIIAGMGGQLIERIVLNCSWLKNPDVVLVLQPQSFLIELKQNLCAEGFEIFNEVPVIDRKKAYLIICMRFTGVCKKISLRQAMIGRLKSADRLKALCYVDAQKKKIVRALKGLNISKKMEENKCKKQLFEKQLAILTDWE